MPPLPISLAAMRSYLISRASRDDGRRGESGSLSRLRPSFFFSASEVGTGVTRKAKENGGHGGPAVTWTRNRSVSVPAVTCTRPGANDLGRSPNATMNRQRGSSDGPVACRDGPILAVGNLTDRGLRAPDRTPTNVST